MQLDNKTVAGLALPDGKTDVIFFDDELKAIECSNYLHLKRTEFVHGSGPRKRNASTSSMSCNAWKGHDQATLQRQPDSVQVIGHKSSPERSTANFGEQVLDGIICRRLCGRGCRRRDHENAVPVSACAVSDRTKPLDHAASK
jgi:hypothetical protein